jgi:hypothetical protein
MISPSWIARITGMSYTQLSMLSIKTSQICFFIEEFESSMMIPLGNKKVDTTIAGSRAT